MVIIINDYDMSALYKAPLKLYIVSSLTYCSSVIEFICKAYDNVL